MPCQEDKDWLKDLEVSRDVKDRRSSQTEEVLEYAQTPQGQWYAKRILRTYEDNQGAHSQSLKIIHLDTERDIPDEFLDPDSITPAMFRAREEPAPSE